MKHISTLLVAVALIASANTKAQDSQTRVIDNAGSGQYKAVMATDQSLTTHTVFKPQDLSPFNDENPLPILVWGNGACANSPFEHVNFLNEIASHGFLVVAIGPMPQEGVEHQWGTSSQSKQLIDAIDWAIAQNNNKESQYFGKLDVNNIAAAGMSCGGLQTLDICEEPRLKAVMICNSGLFVDASGAMPNMPMPSKDKLKQIHTPIIYILGGETDIAYANGMDDFKRIDHVPACACNFNVGHGGTYSQPYGGEFAVVATAWLKWHLKNDAEAAKMFKGENCGMTTRQGWAFEKNTLIDK